MELGTSSEPLLSLLLPPTSVSISACSRHLAERKTLAKQAQGGPRAGNCSQHRAEDVGLQPGEQWAGRAPPVGSNVEGAASSCVRSCRGPEEDQGLRSGRKARVIWGAWEGKPIPWARVELGRKVYPKGLRSWLWPETSVDPNSGQPQSKCAFLHAPSQWSACGGGRRKLR